MWRLSSLAPFKYSMLTEVNLQGSKAHKNSNGAEKTSNYDIQVPLKFIQFTSKTSYNVDVFLDVIILCLLIIVTKDCHV